MSGSSFGVLLPPAEPVLQVDAAAAAVWRVACTEATYQGERATKVEIQGPDVKGLLACLASRLSSLGCDVIGAGSDTVAVGGGVPPQIRDVFHVQAQGKPIAPESQALLVNALKGTGAAMLSATTRPRDKYRVVLTPDTARKATHIAIEGPDVPGLLQALTTTLTHAHCSILTFGGETLEDGMVRDTFVVRKAERPIAPGEQAAIESRLKEACGSLHADGGGHAGESAGRTAGKPAGPSSYRVQVQNQAHAATTTVSVSGPDVPGLLNKLTRALAADGYAIASFSLGKSPSPENSLGHSKLSTSSNHSLSSGGSKESTVHDVFHIMR
jgi:UTP:GlnB (protein PII) uridylyltransferase